MSIPSLSFLAALGACLCGCAPSDADVPAYGPAKAPRQAEPSAGPSLVEFERFGPAPGTTPDQLADWTALIHERYLGQPGPDRARELDDRIAAVDPVDATPAYINALHGQDAADGPSAEAAARLVRGWVEGQAEYKRLALDGDPDDVDAVTVRGRLAVIDGWVRWWRRTLDTDGALETFRQRVADLQAELAALRARRREG